MRRRIVALLVMVVMAITVLLAVGIASADPIKSKNAQILTLNCGGEEVMVVTLFNNNAIVLNVVGSTSNFVTTHIEGTFTFTDPGSGQTVVVPIDEPIGQGQRTGQAGTLTSCTTTFTFEDPEAGAVTVDVTGTGFFTPRGH